jgi:hypothetical protein
VTAWLILTDGVPREPSNQPRTFLTRLVGELAGADARKPKKQSRVDEGYVVTTRGYCGDPNAGYAWESSLYVDDTALPVDEKYVTCGLPGAALVWSVSYWKRGQLGHSAWQNERLAVRLDEHARDVVDRIWGETFGVPPVFEPAQADVAAWCEDRVRELDRSRSG